MGRVLRAEAAPPDIGAKAFKILLIEDDAVDAKWVVRGLATDSKRKYAVDVVKSAGSAPEYLSRQQPDAIVIDLNLPDSKGWRTVREIADKAPGTPIVVLSGQGDYQTMRDALLAGAQTYQVKDRGSTDVLAERIEFAVLRKKREIELAKGYMAEGL